MAKGSSTGRKARRQQSWNRCNNPGGKKDKRVEKSSHGKYKSRSALPQGSKRTPVAVPVRPYEEAGRMLAQIREAREARDARHSHLP